MTVELNKQQNILITGSTPTNGVSNPNAVKNATSIVNGGEVGSPVDKVSTTQNQITTQKKTKRTVDELYNSISSLCTQYGISLSEVKKLGLLSSVSGMNEEYLLNAEQSEINKIIEHLKQTITALKEDGIEINATNVEKYARKYQRVLNGGWNSIKSFRKANNCMIKRDDGTLKQNNETVIERLDRMAKARGETPFSQLTSVEERANALKKYFKDFFDNKIKDGMSEEKIKKLQLTDFSKLLYNTSDSEKDVLRDAIQYLAGDSRYTALKSLFDACDSQEARTQLANTTTHKMMQAMSTKDENFHIAPNSKDMTAMTALLIREKDAEHITEYHNDAQKARKEFFAKFSVSELNEIFAKIKTKISKGEELTDEEQALLFHTADAAGEIIGVGNNRVVSDDFKSEMLTTLNTDAYSNPNYREVLEHVADYVKEHPETLTMSEDEFVKLMDEVTEGNYSKVINDVAKGTKTELTPPTPKDEKTSATKNTTNSNTNKTTTSKNADSNVVDSRYTAPTVSTTDALAQVQNSKTELYKKSEQTDSNFSQDKETPLVTSGASMEAYFQAYSGEVAFKKVQDEFGTMTAIQFTLNKNFQNATARLSAIKVFDRINCSQQLNILETLFGGGLSFALDNTKDNTLERSQNVTFRTFGATKEVRKAAEEREATA